MNEKQQFIVNELWILAWSASVQRAKLYKKDVDITAKQTNKFREDLVQFLKEKIIPLYSASSCNEEQHYKNIDDLIIYANRINPGILSDLGYKYGVAQKLLNLALKYYWCTELIKEPPHCPIDRIIINKTKYNGKINWTQISERSQYEKIIKEIKALADKKNLSIPMWELKSFRRR